MPKRRVRSMQVRSSIPSRSAVPFPDVAYLAALKPFRMNLSLTNIAALFDKMGNPQKRYPSVLVAGTNGKGSVTTYVSSALRSMGLRVGTYYSPHIFRLHERIRCDGKEISSYELNTLIRDVRAVARGIPITYFECLTAVAARFFLEKRVDAAVIEVGLGGRLDATNLVSAILTVITGISHDHREHLGRTKEAILAEKLGIVREGVPLVASLGSKRLLAKAKRHCERVGAPFHSVRSEVRSDLALLSPEGMHVRVLTPRRDYGALATRMIGIAQAGNVATAVRAIETLEDAGFPVSVDAGAVRRGIASAFLAGRFQVVSREPRIILDVSHNEESLLAALGTLERISRPERNTIVFGALAHKELGAFPARAVGAARRIIVTGLRDRRSASEERLRDLFEAARGMRRGGASIAASPGMAGAIREARRSMAPGDTLLIMGSHITVAEAAVFI
jgi:dihydrofolate synthase/folylpolyglutamate synthase